MTERARPSGGQQAGRLLLAAGAFTLVNNYLPGAEHLDIAVLNATAATAIVLGAVSLRLPWHRLHPRASLLLVLPAFALLVLSNIYGGVSPYSYAVYYVVVFVWVGLSQPPGTSLLLSPLLAVSYLLPFVVRDPPPTAISSVTVAVPVCVLVGEVLARSVRRLESSRAELAAQVEEVVRQQEHEQAVVDALADGVLVIDGRGTVTAANRAASQLLAVPVDELVGRPPPLHLAPHGTPVEHEAPGGCRVEAVGSPIPGTDETVVALHDVSRQRALDEAKDLFLATTGHELRTPLTAIKGYVRILQRRWDVMSEDQRLQALRTISERTDALVELADHLLAGAAATGRRDPSRFKEFDLGQALRAAVQAHADLTPRHRLVLDVPDRLPPALGDPSALNHVVGQLVENAVKYSPGGGDVVLRARADERSVQVEVADRGVGIPPGAEDEVFAPFYQAAPVNTREFGGVGLGLYIVRQLVEAQGGSVQAANRDGGGTVVTFRLPRAVIPTAREEVSSPAEEGSARP